MTLFQITRMDVFSTLTLCVLAASCGSSPGNGTVDLLPADMASAARDLSMSGTCGPGGTFGGGEQSVSGSTVTATIVDQAGSAVVGQPAYLCGINACTPAVITNATGQVSIATGLTLTKPAFKVGDALNYAELVIPLTAAHTDFGTLATARLPAVGPQLTPGTDASSGGVTLTIPAGAIVTIDTLTYSTPAQQQLRIASLDVTKSGPFLSGVMVAGKPAQFGAAFGFAPAETLFCPPVKVTAALPHAKLLPNDLGWAPGALVEFWLTTTDVGQKYAPYAGWTKISDGTVSADGTSVVTAAGQGFNFGETFAVRLKQ